MRRLASLDTTSAYKEAGSPRHHVCCLWAAEAVPRKASLLARRLTTLCRSLTRLACLGTSFSLEEAGLPGHWSCCSRAVTGEQPSLQGGSHTPHIACLGTTYACEEAELLEHHFCCSQVRSGSGALESLLKRRGHGGAGPMEGCRQSMEGQCHTTPHGYGAG